MSQKEIKRLSAELAALESELLSEGADLFCDIKLDAGDWGGSQVLVEVTPAAGVHLARQLLDLVQREARGAHLHVDKASIALDTDHQLVIAVRDG